MVQRLPVPGSDNNTWGDILNAYLETSLASDGTLNSSTVGTAQIQNGAVTNAQLDSPSQTALSKANSAVQSSQLGAASGVATLNGSSQLTNGQIPSTVENGRVAAQAGDVGDFSSYGAFVPNPSWGSGHTYRDVNKDGIFYIQNFVDDSGTTNAYYNNVFGVRATKQNAGQLNAHWASIDHQGSGQAGLFIGDVTADSAGLGGDIWGGDFSMIFNLAANSTGLRVVFTPNVDVSSKTQKGIELANQVDANAITQGLRIRGNFTNPIIVYSDAAATVPIFELDHAGDLSVGGGLSPLSGGNDLGNVSFKWRNGYWNSTLFVAASGAPTVGGGSGGIYIGNAAVNPTSSPSNGGFLYTDATSHALSWYGSDGTNGKVMIGATAQPTARTRALGTAYQPSTTRPTVVIVTMNMSAGSGSTSGVKIYMDSSSTPSTEIMRSDIGQAGGTAPPTIASNVPLTFIVPTGYYYEIVNLGGSPPIVETMEYTL